MDIVINSENEKVVIKIQGIVVSIDDTSRIKTAIHEEMQRNSKAKIELLIVDSYLIPSSLIGALLKLVHENKADISIIAGNEQLYYLIDRLKLVKLLNVQKGF